MAPKRNNAMPEITLTFGFWDDEDELIVEAVYDPSTRKGLLLVKTRDGWGTFPQFEYKGKIYKPLIDSNVENCVTFLPIAPIPFGTVADLHKTIRQYIHNHVDLSPVFEDLAARYVLMTWVYQRFDKIPYLRIVGLPGSGKTRLLAVLAPICYHTCNLGVSVSKAVIYRSLEVYKGTLVMDEFSLEDSDTKSAMEKILNGGCSRGEVVTKCRPSDFMPIAFQAFGPKIIASRYNSGEDAFESRVISETSHQTTRKDIPLSLPDKRSWKQVQDLRNMLLAFRLECFFTVDASLKVEGLEKFSMRTQETYAPLCQVTNTTKLPEEILAYIVDREEEKLASASFNLDAIVATVVCDLARLGSRFANISTIASNVREKIEDISAKKVGLVVHALGFKSKKMRNGYCVELGADLIQQLRERYGITYSPGD